ncbi:FecR family protein [Sphingosinicella rhizophila]|uniref:FecR domain-containing protein n=1 Tax=Sphingosinicella rhizophila TaxID=3050082 RepID=A0ABU3Q9S0_9SPHN|nr:FecR domain-containing protein [Sphingosinicella sp. GR2756]MDT9600121.1 FecR domain-containing protein [Sphingosinicella sp. GR2756]
MSGPAHRATDLAALWILRQEEPDWTAEQQAELDAWLDESLLHRAAYLRLREGWRRADAVARDEAPETPDEIQQAAPRRWQPWAMAASIALIFGISGTTWWRAPAPVAPVNFATPIGGHQTIGLADGSRVELNTATAVRAAIDGDMRTVWLDRGEAYFEVAHRNGVPFVVHAGVRKITVLGTKFSVRREGDKVSVAVTEGRVRVEDLSPAKASRAAVITAGDLAIARGGSTLVALGAKEKVEDALAWREGMLTFTSTTLGDAVAEFSRYSSRPILIPDAAVAAIRIDGAFEADNVDAFLRLLSDAYGLRVEQDAKHVRISA